MARRGMLLASAVLVLQSPIAVAQTGADSRALSAPVISLRPGASALLAIDQNRATVIDRIVAQWGEALAQSSAALSAQQLRSLLSGLRADHLLAASLAGNLEGLRNAISQAISSTAAVSPSLIHTKALGDSSDDLVYTPVVPCRIVDTRNAGGQIGSNSSRDFNVWVSSGGFGAQGGSATNCNVPANPVAVVLNITAVTPSGAGNFIAYPTGSPTFTSVLNYQSGENALANGAIVPACVPNCAKQLTIATNGAGADAVIDIAGYFKPPSGTIQPSNILWVAPSGGNYTSIQAAINAAATLATVNNPYLVRIAPGVYTEQVTLKDFVDVEGSGERGTTTIQFSTATPTVTAGAYCDLRNVAIVNTFNGASPGAVAIAQSANTANGNTLLKNVAVVADGPLDNTAIYVTGGFLNLSGGNDVEAALSATQTGVEIALWAVGATSNVVVKNSSLNPESGTTRLAARRDSGSLVRIENTQMKGTTQGTPLCFNNFVPSTYTLAACP